jgi:hypothetical protein
VYWVALGDLDIVAGRDWWGWHYEMIAWEDSGSPFSDPCSHNDIGASADNILSLAPGDLEEDWDLDIVSGSGAAEDYEVIAYRNFASDWHIIYVPLVLKNYGP